MHNTGCLTDPHPIPALSCIASRSTARRHVANSTQCFSISALFTEESFTLITGCVRGTKTKHEPLCSAAGAFAHRLHNTGRVRCPEVLTSDAGALSRLWTVLPWCVQLRGHCTPGYGLALTHGEMRLCGSRNHETGLLRVVSVVNGADPVALLSDIEPDLLMGSGATRVEPHERRARTGPPDG